MVETNESPRQTSVAIVGGGLAGLAAAARLTQAGVKTTIIESRTVLGGRAGSFVDPTTGATIDNCQHVSMRCCTNLAHFCKTVGIDDLFTQERELYFQDESGAVSRVRNSWLPAPLHQLPSFLGLKFLTWGEKLRIGWAVDRMFRDADPGTNVSILDWLKSHRQTPRVIQRYWEVVLVSALNETLDRIDYRYARQVFVEGFFANRDACTVEIPRVPLGELYGKPLIQWLEQRGVTIHFITAAKQIEIADDSVTGVRLKNDQVLEADHVVLAVPFHRTLDLLPPRLHDLPPFAGIARLEASPITSVHVWFDRPVMDWPHLVIVGRTIQWLFRRDDVKPGYIQAVISASRELAKLGRDAIAEKIIAEIRSILPRSADAQVQHIRVVTERSATYSIVPGVEVLRPDVTTPIRNLWLAGDYVRTGWPATMEGAVRSGYLAADAILCQTTGIALGLELPLPTAALAKLLIRRSRAER